MTLGHEQSDLSPTSRQPNPHLRSSLLAVSWRLIHAHQNQSRTRPIHITWSLASVRSDLLGRDVGVPGVPGNFGDHAQIDEPQAYRTDDVMLGAVFGDRPGKAFAGSDAEAGF